LNPRAELVAQAFAQPVSGPSYRPLTRVLAVALVLALFVWGARTMLAVEPGTLDRTHWATAVVIALALLWPLPTLLLGRTVLDANGIRQLGWMGRDAEWAQVQRIRFVRMPMSPRLMISVGIGRIRSFHSGSPELDAAFERATRILTGPIEEAR
jgi:hypothetical protein